MRNPPSHRYCFTATAQAYIVTVQTLHHHSPSLHRFLLRELKDFWRFALLISTILHPIDINDTEDESSQLSKRRDLFTTVESSVIKLDFLFNTCKHCNCGNCAGREEDGHEIRFLQNLRNLRKLYQQLMKLQMAIPRNCLTGKLLT